MSLIKCTCTVDVWNKIVFNLQCNSIYVINIFLSISKSSRFHFVSTRIIYFHSACITEVLTHLAFRLKDVGMWSFFFSFGVCLPVTGSFWYVHYGALLLCNTVFRFIFAAVNFCDYGPYGLLRAFYCCVGMKKDIALSVPEVEF